MTVYGGAFFGIQTLFILLGHFKTQVTIQRGGDFDSVPEEKSP